MRNDYRAKRYNLFLSESGPIFLFAMFAMTVMQFIVTAAAKNAGSFGSLSVANWICNALNQVCFAATVLIFFKVRAISFPYATRINRKLNPKQGLLLPLVLAFTLIAFMPIANMFVRLLNVMGYSYSLSVPQSNSVTVFIPLLIVTAILPAFGEEIMMRGAVLSGLKNRGYIFGAMLSAVLFALMHGNLTQIVYQFFFGVVLAIVVLLTGSLWASIIMHLLNNAVSLVIMYYIPTLNNLDLGGFNWLLWVALIPVGIIGLTLSLELLSRAKGNRNRVVASIEYENATLTITDNSPSAKQNVFRAALFDIKGIFSKRGWQSFESRLASCDDDTLLPGTSNRHALFLWVAIGYCGLMLIINLVSSLG